MKKNKKLPKNLINHNKNLDDQVINKIDYQNSYDKSYILNHLDNIQTSNFINVSNNFDENDIEVSNQHFNELVNESNDKELIIKKKNIFDDFIHKKANLKIKESENIDTKEINMENNMKFEDSKEIAVISKSMSINGDLELESQIIVHGQIVGNLICKELVEITNDSIVKGDIRAKSIKCAGADLTGNILVDESIETNNQTKIYGNINALKVEVSGMVEGDIFAKESILLKKTAIVKGNISSPLISIESGAMVDGRVNTKIDQNLLEV